jgi:hypothetical protein
MEKTKSTEHAVEAVDPPTEPGAVESEAPVKEPLSATARRVLAKAVTVGALSAIVALGSGGTGPAVGALVGCLAAAVYVVGYVRSHVFRKFSDSTFEPEVTRYAAMRIGVIVAAGVAVYVVLGDAGATAYLLALGACWLILVATEAPRALKQLRARGIIG